MIDAIAAAEDDLIEDYLADQLTAEERHTFERGYLTAPAHLRRVETVRQLIAASHFEPGGTAASATATASTQVPGGRASATLALRWLAAAAALVVVAAGSVWMMGVRPDRPPRVALDTPPTGSIPAAPPSAAVPPPAPSPAVRMFAVSLSPVAVRSAAGPPAVIVPTGTEVIVVQLEGEGAPIVRGRGSIRTVSGDSTWDGPTTSPPNGPSGIVARLDVPAALVPADDYIVTLLATDANGAEQERARYFLRVRER